MGSTMIKTLAAAIVIAGISMETHPAASGAIQKGALQIVGAKVLSRRSGAQCVFLKDKQVSATCVELVVTQSPTMINIHFNQKSGTASFDSPGWTFVLPIIEKNMQETGESVFMTPVAMFVREKGKVDRVEITGGSCKLSEKIISCFVEVFDSSKLFASITFF